MKSSKLKRHRISLISVMNNVKMLKGNVFHLISVMNSKRELLETTCCWVYMGGLGFKDNCAMFHKCVNVTSNQNATLNLAIPKL